MKTKQMRLPLAAALLTAACFGLAACNKPAEKSASTLIQSVGDGEKALNLVAWEGYAEDQWVKPFEAQTGCVVNRKYAGSSDEMVALMRQGGQYDLVSASGDATLRLIAGKAVQEVNTALIPDFANFIPELQSPPHNTVDGKLTVFRICGGPNVLMWDTRAIKTAPTSWSVIYDPKYKGKITVPDNPIQIADAALYLSKTKPELGITDPYELTPTAIRCGDRTAENPTAAYQEVLGVGVRRNLAVLEPRRVRGRGLAVSGDHIADRETQSAGRQLHSFGGRDGLGRHLDAIVVRAASELRL